MQGQELRWAPGIYPLSALQNPGGKAAGIPDTSQQVPRSSSQGRGAASPSPDEGCRRSGLHQQRAARADWHGPQTVSEQVPSQPTGSQGSGFGPGHSPSIFKGIALLTLMDQESEELWKEIKDAARAEREKKTKEDKKAKCMSEQMMKVSQKKSQRFQTRSGNFRDLLGENQPKEGGALLPSPLAVSWPN